MKALMAFVAALLFIAAAPTGETPKKLTAEDYIQTYKQLSINEMHRSGIPASITLAQGILESGSGNSRLATEGKNHFGIKCHKGWTGPAIYADDDEENECFRKYENVEQSFIDHSEFLRTRSRYAFLFELERTDYKGWARGLKKAGYATNPKYADLLIDIIERYNLQQYDHAEPKQIFVVDDQEDQQEAEVYVKKVFFTNRIKTAYLQPDQTLIEFAKFYDIPSRRLERYNEIDSKNKLEAGMNVYLQPKRRKADVDYHVVQPGETVYQISQMYGIKTKFIYKRNHFEEGQEPAAGEKLYLRKKRDTPVKIRTKAEEQQLKEQQQREAKAREQKKQERKQREHNIPEKKREIQDEKKAQAPVEEKMEFEELNSPVEEQKKEAVEAVQKIDEEEAKAVENQINEDLQLTPSIHKKESEEPVQEQPVRRNTTNDVKYIYTPSGDDTNAAPNNEVKDLNVPVEVEKRSSFEQTDKLAYIYHKVEPQETLYSLSKRYNTTVEQIKLWNKLEDNNIKIGQSLIVGVVK